MGHACGISFNAREHLAAHPEQAWQKDILIDMPASPWTQFHADA
jgi:hypothetical protein